MASLAFNATFYLTQNPDVATAIARGQFASAEDHYNQFGAFEGRNPNEYFDSAFYLAQNPDVLNARVNPFQHFLQFGAAEGRFQNNTADAALDTNDNNRADEFDAAAYLDANKDVADAVAAGTLKSAYQHFVLFGQFESRPGVTVGPFTNSGVAQGTGSTFTLTTAVDTLNGTSANDQFNAVIDGSNNTLQTGDSINGGAGTDTLRIVATSATTASTAPLATLRGVENINVNATVDTALNLTDATGVQNVTLTGLAGGTDLTIAGLSNIVTLGATNTTSATSDRPSVSATYAAAAVSGTADVQNIVVNNAAATTFSVNGIESFAINAASGVNGVTLASSGTTVTSVSVTGAGDLTVLNQLANTVTTFDASKATGDVSASFAAGGNVAVTGGAGDDVFTFAGTGTTGTGAGITTADTINGGAGFDTVRVEAGTTGLFSGPAAAAPFNSLVSIERVAFDGTAGVTVNGTTFTNAGITNIEFNTSSTSAGDTVDNAGSARTYEFGVDNDGSATFNMNASSTTLNLALLGTAAGADADVGALNVNLNAAQATGAVSTINLSSQGTLSETTFNNVGTVTAAAGSTMVVTGSGNLDITGFTNRAIIDASAHTGSIVVEGSNFTANGSGTAFVSGADVITLGAGRDTVRFTDATASGLINTTSDATTAQGIQFDTINGFTAGANGDLLDFGAATATTTPVGFTALSATAQTSIADNAATLVEAANIAVANTAAATVSSSVGAGTWTAFSFQGETYAVYDAADLSSGTETYVSGTDLLVKLAGVDVAALTAANFA